jgi:hypothetical protein
MGEREMNHIATGRSLSLGGECHIPKIWNVKINKIRTMYVCID